MSDINVNLYQGLKDYNAKTRRWVKKCPDGQVRDMKTFKCVKNRNAPCPDGQQRNPVTGRCVKIAKPETKGKEKKTRGKIVKNPEDCPKGTKFNPKTRRCNKTILKKDCKKGEVNHPKTGRCISLLKLRMIQEQEGEESEREFFNYVIHPPTKRNMDCVKRSKLKLREYQENICKFMDNNRGIIVVHGVGTGKTLTSVTVSQCYLDEHPKGKVIVSTPKSLLENFKKELKTYGANVDDPRYVFVTHHGLANIVKEQPLSYFKDALLIMDEVHNFRTNPLVQVQKHGKTKQKFIGKSLAYYAVKAAHNSNKVLGLTATPIVNSLADLKNPISMITGKYINKFPKEASLDNMSEYKSLFSVYFRPENDPEYPTKYVSPVNVKMTKAEYARYIDLETLLTKRNKKFSKTFHISHRIANNNLDNRKNSPKVKWSLDKISNGQKTLIYSSFRNSGSEYIGRHLDELKIPYAAINGSKTKEERKKIVEEYNAENSKLRVLIITAAGSEGLDLKETRQVILFDPVWNDANEIQIVGRAVRKNSHKRLKPEDRDVKVYKLLLSGPNDEETVDHHLSKLIAAKKDLTSEAIEVMEKLSIDLHHNFQSPAKTPKLKSFDGPLFPDALTPSTNNTQDSNQNT